MDDIAEAAGVTKPLLYQHFASKRALYLELLDSVSHTMLEAIGKAIAAAGGPRQQVEGGFAAYFHLVVTHADAFHLLFGSDVPNDPELSRAVRKVEDSIAESIDVLIDAGLDEDHRRLLAFAVVGMAEGASRHFLAVPPPDRGRPPRIGGHPPGAAAGRPGVGRPALGPPRLTRPGPGGRTEKLTCQVGFRLRHAPGVDRTPGGDAMGARRSDPSSASRTP